MWRHFPIFRILYIKGSFEARPLYEKWNSYSRVRVNGNQDALVLPQGWGLSRTLPPDLRVRQLQMDIDRDKAQALGVSFDSINSALSTSLGSSYINDFPNKGRLQRVIVQADAPARMQPEDLLRINVVGTRRGRSLPRFPGVPRDAPAATG